MAISKKAKYYVLDTNILLSSPDAIYGFDDNVVVITGTVLQELDFNKTKPGDTGFNARESIRIIESLRDNGNILDGVALSSKGVFMIEPDGVHSENLPNGYSIERPDNKIISTCIHIQNKLRLDGKPNLVTLVSNDISMRINAAACGVLAEAYRNDRIASDKDEVYLGRETLEVSYEIIDDIYKNQKVNVEGSDYNFVENEFVTLKCGSSSALSIYKSGYLHLIKEQYACNIKCLNAAQKYALWALLAPVEEIPLVILKGEAGTAKTFLSLAAALEKICFHAKKEESEYNRILITRNNVTADKDFGALPGELGEKMGPLVAPFMDNLGQIIDIADMKDNISGEKLKSQDLFDNGILELCPLAYIRGRSLAKSFFIVDECQNTTRSQMRDIITRAGDKTKIVICGDPKQIDNPVLDRWNNGLAFVSDNFKGSKLCAQLTFTEKECVRSKLATEALKLLNL